MPSEETPSYLEPYSKAVETHGGTFDAMLWRTREGQILRFHAFRKEIDFSGMSIVDIGCGIGDFAEYLLDANIEFCSFKGIDAMDAMIKTASERDLERSSFEVGDVLKDKNIMGHADWFLMSGTLNAMTQDDAMQLVEYAFQTCSIGVAFNFLSNQSWRDAASEDLTPASRFDTCEVLRFAFTLTPLVAFTQTYLLGHDATIILRKQKVTQ